MNRFYERFNAIQENRVHLERYLKKYSDRRQQISEYLIAMTPRSGSSWLTELLASTAMVGNPEEWFNDSSLPGILNFYQCSNFQDYLCCIKGDQSTPNGVFGIEATFFQLSLVLQGTQFEKIFQDNLKIVYLTRNDFIAQGISLYRAVESGIFHSYQSTKTQSLQYSSTQIKKWILHILHQEYYWEALFLDKGFQPLRLSYEDLVADVTVAVQSILSYLKVSGLSQVSLPSITKHRKLAGDESQLFWEKFQVNQEFIQLCQKYRGKSEILRVRQ